MAKRASGLELPAISCDLVITGEAIDDRGRAALAWVAGKGSDIVACRFDPSSQEFYLGGDRMCPSELAEALVKRGRRRFLFECTTLGTPEIALCCKALSESDHVVCSFLYVEPRGYKSSDFLEGFIRERDFDLSVDFQGFWPIPGVCFQMHEDSKQTTVFLVGFEGDRAQRALEELKIARPGVAVVLGVPAFKPGWECDTLANNIQLLSIAHEGRGISYCGADNPKAVMQLLHQISCDVGSDEPIFIAPLGTKPQAIGAALFAAFTKQTGLLYDFPVHRNSRSNEISKWHLFQAAW